LDYIYKIAIRNKLEGIGTVVAKIFATPARKLSGGKGLSIFQANAQKMWPSTGSEILMACKVKMLDA
jgi:hypothetical protein